MGGRQHLEASAPDRSQSLELPDSQPVRQNLHIADDDDITVGTNLEYQAEETATDGTSATTHSSRYPRREHRVPTRYSDYVPISYVKDKMFP